MAAPLEFYGYWRSQAMYRLRVAMNLKGISYREKPINLDAGEQLSEDFLKINPMGSVPTIMIDTEDGKEALTQSLAILEYLEETHPSPKLLPSDPFGRARVRSLSSLVIADSHPLIVPRIREYLKKNAGFDPKQWKEWQTQWFTAGLQGFEARLAGSKHTGDFCHGNEPTIADICLVGMVNGTRAFEIEVPNIPTVHRIVAKCEALDAFEKAKGIHQADYPGKK